MTAMSPSDKEKPMFHVNDIRFADAPKLNFLCLNSKVDVKSLYSVEKAKSSNITTFMTVS